MPTTQYVAAGEWSPIVVPTGPYREQIQATPIPQRPGRPLHVYGNAVRMLDQMQHQQTVRPLRQIFLGTSDLRRATRVH